MTNLEQLQQRGQAGVQVSQPDAQSPAVEWDEFTHGFSIVRPALKESFPVDWDKRLGAAYASAQTFLAQHGTLDGWSPTAGELGGTFQQARFKMHQRHKEEARELAKQHGRKAQWLNQKDTDQCIREGLDDIAQGRAPSGTRYLRNRGKGAEYVNKVRSLRNDSQNAKALQSLAEHTVLRTIDESALEVSAMHRGTLSGCLKNVAAHYINAEKLTEQVRREVAKATASLMVEQAATNKRLEIVEAGEHWHDIARRMRSEGQGPSAIAQATGQKLNTVKVYLKRQNKGCE
ncbi:TPA: hypothetical protein QDZ23_005871 [Pseudomonas putida]|nr:hypothetical protein [Pseudomonas putida]